MKTPDIFTSANCPGVPKGAIVRFCTGQEAKDQPAAWANARKKHADIWWEIKLEEMQERANA